MPDSKHHAADRSGIACTILTISDSRTVDTDTSGAVIRRCLEEAGHRVVGYEILPDQATAIEVEVGRLADDPSIELVVLNGGTGLSPRDTTHEAVARMLTKTIDGFGELFRMLSWQEIGAAAMLSRAVGGLVGNTVVFSLPGSTPACRLGMEKLIVPEISHVVALAQSAAAGGTAHYT